MPADEIGVHSYMPYPDCLLVQVTCPHNDAESLANALVEAHVAACVNIIPRIRSIYRWGDLVNAESESLLLIKTTRRAYPLLEQMVIDLHPYDVPEVIAFSITNGFASYLSWLHASVPSCGRGHNEPR